jgi:hypothetical protein
MINGVTPIDDKTRDQIELKWFPSGVALEEDRTKTLVHNVIDIQDLFGMITVHLTRNSIQVIEVKEPTDQQDEAEDDYLVGEMKTLREGTL